jgi:hypothetical protein
MRLERRAVVGLYRLAFGLLTFIAIAWQMVSLASAGTLDAVHYLTFFTILSNEIAAALFLIGAVRWKAGHSTALDFVRGAAVVYMCITGIVFAVLLSGTNVDTAIPWVNSVVHELMPIVVVADWLVDPPQTRLTYRQGALWLAFPAAWIGYELIRGAITGRYHYPFTNPSNGGYGTVALTSVAILVLMLVVSAAVVWLGNLRRQEESPRQPAYAGEAT